MVTIATARVDIYEEIYDVLDNYLTTSGVKIGAAFSDDVTDFPQIVIHIPIIPKTRESFGDETKSYNRSGSVDIEVFADTPKLTAQLIDDIDNTISTHKSSLSIQNIEFGSSSDVPIDLGGKTIYGMLIPISFKFSR